MERLWRFETVEYNPDCISGMSKSNDSPLSSLQTQAPPSARSNFAPRTDGKLLYRCMVIHWYEI